MVRSHCRRHREAMSTKLAFLVIFCAVVLLPAIVQCRSLYNRSRRSGISDQRLAELETLAGLKSLRHRLKGISFPVAYGLVDPNKIGKRKRSFESLEDSQQPQQQQGGEYQTGEDGGLEDLLSGMPTPDVVSRMRPSSDQLLRI
ncbi:unnamed protein product [Ixodes persulcatus]